MADKEHAGALLSFVVALDARRDEPVKNRVDARRKRSKPPGSGGQSSGNIVRHRANPFLTAVRFTQLAADVNAAPPGTRQLQPASGCMALLGRCLGSCGARLPSGFGHSWLFKIGGNPND